jgi:thiol:disulfide interchange protein
MRVLAVSSVALATVLCSCGGSGQAPAGAATQTWFEDDFEAASAQASASGKPLLMDLYADWCGPCRTLSEEYFTDPSMQELLGRFVLLRVDVDSEAGGPLAQRYAVDAIPCVVIAAADGTEYDRIVGVAPTVAAYKGQLEQILGELDR